MNRKIYALSLSKGTIVLTILLYFVCFACYTFSVAEGKTTLKSAIVNMHYERGLRLYKQGSYNRAIEEFKRVLELNSAHAKARKYLTAAVKRKNKKIIDELYKEARGYYKQKENQKALDTYKKVLEIKPDDRYSLYTIEMLKSKIEKLEKLKENARYRVEQRTEELEKLTEKKKEKERLLKEEAAKALLESQSQEREKQKKELEQMIEESVKEKYYQEEEKTLVKKIALEKEIVSRQDEELKKYVSAKSRKKEPEDMAKKEGLYKIKILYEMGKKYYNKGLYRRAIEAFRQVVDLEGDYDILYTPHADSYIEKSKEKLREQIRSDKLKEIKDIESEMITKVIEAARISTEPFLGTMTRDIFPPTPVSIADIHRKMDIPVNMDFQDVDVVYVLDYLSETTGANVVMSSAVTKGKRTVSVKIKDMPLEDALKYVLKSASLTYRIDKNVIWIATPEEINNEQMETRVFTLKKGKGTYTEFSSPTTGGVGLGSAGNIEEVITIKDIIEEALTWPSGSKIVLDERLAALIVTNTPYNLEIIEKILEKIDIEPIQVLIEARFLEITVTDLNELGIDWQLGSELPFDKTKVGMVHGIASGSGTSFTDTTRQTEGFNLTYQGVLTKPQFQVMLHALEETQKVKTLSAPRITTLDNQMATIKVVDEWIYPTRYEFQIVQFDLNGDGDFNDANETLYKNVPTDFVKRDVGILLRVVPSVGMEDDVITLTLIPEVSDGTAGYFSYSGDVSLPLFTSRNLTTSVVVNNGDTVVLGGLIKETESTVETKIPILGDLPWVGPFFRKDTSSITRKNLLIFVTASIISKSGEEVVLRRVAQ